MKKFNLFNSRVKYSLTKRKRWEKYISDVTKSNDPGFRVIIIMHLSSVEKIKINVKINSNLTERLAIRDSTAGNESK